MIWDNVSDGIWDSGYYRLRRVVKGWEVWWMHPKNMHLLSKPATLHDAKNDAEQHAKGKT